MNRIFFIKNKKTPKNIIYLQIDDVVNAAIINHGISLDSNTHKAIHFGHIQIQKGGELCYCGGSGCLEKEISIAAILVKAAELLRNNYPDSYLSVNEIKIENICAGVHLGDPLCLYLFNHIAELLAKPLSTMINIFGTELVLINSPLNQAENIFFSLLHQYCSEQVMPLYTNNLQIKKSELSKKQSETALIQQALYDGSLLIQLLQG
ncbi:ROK family protein [Providencia sneebia]|uniref:ROK family protein n=1 Tax=Providencia sneebia TaxID=516075 RepID=UPI001F406754|nr:ROK family protein [Providencia sneebia]